MPLQGEMCGSLSPPPMGRTSLWQEGQNKMAPTMGSLDFKERLNGGSQGLNTPPCWSLMSGAEVEVIVSQPSARTGNTGPLFEQLFLTTTSTQMGSSHQTSDVWQEVASVGGVIVHEERPLRGGCGGAGHGGSRFEPFSQKQSN